MKSPTFVKHGYFGEGNPITGPITATWQVNTLERISENFLLWSRVSHAYRPNPMSTRQVLPIYAHFLVLVHMRVCLCN